MLFTVNKENSLILDSEAIKLCPGLKKISDEEILFVVLAYDYKSPYHQFPEEERVRKAKRHVWGTIEGEQDQKDDVLEAIDLYRSLQYDVRRETIINYSKKIDHLNRLLANEESARNIKSLDETIDRLLQRIDTLQNEVDKADESVELKGGGKLSLIEKWQRNMI